MIGSSAGKHDCQRPASAILPHLLSAQSRFASAMPMALMCSSDCPMADATATESREQPAKRDRLLPLIAAERGVRALVLIVLGVVLLTHPHTNWAREVRELANDWGLNPSSNVVRKILEVVRKFPARETVVFGAIAIAYGALEAAESYGLARR